jgi:hypothetical protein
MHQNFGIRRASDALPVHTENALYFHHAISREEGPPCRYSLACLPGEIQSFVRWSGVVGTNSAAPLMAKDLLKFLAGPAAVPVLKSQGMEHGE